MAFVLRSTYERALAKLNDARNRLTEAGEIATRFANERDAAREIAEQRLTMLRVYATAIGRQRAQRNEARAEVTRLTTELARRSERPRGPDGKFLRSDAAA